MKREYFYFDEAPSFPNKHMIRVNHEALGCTYTEGSYNVLCARLLGLDYPTYLRYCRDVFGAELNGKGHLYAYPVFDKTPLTRQLVKTLNAIAALIIFEREHPNFEEHKSAVEEHKKMREALYKA